MDARAPLITAVSVSGSALRTLAATRADRYPVFFDSAAEGPLARYSVLGAEPRAALFRDAAGRLHGQGITPGAGGFFDNLEAWYRQEAATASQKPLPSLGG